MSLIVLRSKVKEKCGITGTDFDSQIDSLIVDTVPVLEYAIAPGYIADTGNTGLQATLNLGATEIVSGEFLAQLGRQLGAYDWIVLGDFEVRPVTRMDTGDPSGLLAQGWTRLGPYLKEDVATVAPRPVHFVRGKGGDEEE
jgi:hypothetical protein